MKTKKQKVNESLLNKSYVRIANTIKKELSRLNQNEKYVIKLALINFVKEQ